MEAVQFYCSWFCPYAQRAWIALEEKGIAYDYVEIDPYLPPPPGGGRYSKQSMPLDDPRRNAAHMAANPRGLVPALTHEGDKVHDR